MVSDLDPKAPPHHPDPTPRAAPEAASSLGASSASSGPWPAERTPATKPKKVMHSVPGDALTALREAAIRTGKTNTDIVLECLVSHGAAIQAEQSDSGQLTALERRVRAARRRGRERAGQLTLYLTPAERAEIDAMVRAAGMNRSRLVTEALDRGIGEIQ